MTKRSPRKWRTASVRGAVLRGDLLRLRRRGDRVWIRYRPYEIVWRTTHSFAVDDIQRIEIQPVTRERRRRRVILGHVRSRMSEAVLTRLTIQDAHRKVAIELNETPAAIAEVFADLQDRLAVEGGWHQITGTNTDPQLTLFSWRDSGDRDASEPVGDDLFSEGPPKIACGASEPVGDDLFSGDPQIVWRRHSTDDNPEAVRSPSMSSRDLLLFPFEEPSAATGHGVWIRKRTPRTRRFFT